MDKRKKKHKQSQQQKRRQATAPVVRAASLEAPQRPPQPARTRSAPKLLILVPVVMLAVVSVWGIGVWIRRSDSIDFPKPREIAASPNLPTFDDFVGSEACEEYHLDQYEVWLSSTHGRAGGEPAPNVIIAPFNGEPIRFLDAFVTPSIDNDGKYIFTIEQVGTPTIVVEVTGAVGGGHMVGGGTQGFVSEFADGTIRFLPFDYIRDEAVWFCNTDDAWVPITPSMPLSECMDWPPYRIAGTERRNDTCQECHGSQILLTYDPEADRYDTKVLSLTINCESCHGPSRRHVELADAGLTDEADDIGVDALSPLDKDGSLGVCFRCHALKSVVKSGFLPGKPLDDHYSLHSWLVRYAPFHPDGRVKFFAYQQNHLYSDGYPNGSMTCVDCHDPHSQEYRDKWGQELTDRFADEQCTDCHPRKATNPELHTFHEPGTPGSACVDCHMPHLQHPGIGAQLRFARSDHTIPIPRPGADDRMGIVNACALAGCHADSSAQALEAITSEWFGDLKPRKTIIEAQFDTLATYDRVTAATMLLHSDTRHPIAQVTAMGHFVQYYLRPNMGRLETSIIESFRDLAGDTNLDIKSVALATLHFALGDTPDIRRYLANVMNDLDSADGAVRGRWVTALHLFGEGLQDQQDYQDAITVYNKALEVLPNHAGVLYSLAWTYDVLHDFATAIEYYERSLAIAPNQPDLQIDLHIARENLAMARNGQATRPSLNSGEQNQ